MDDRDGPLQDYLARFTRLARLSAEEETGLAARIAAGRLAEGRLAEGGGTLTGEARASLERIGQDGSQAVTRLLEANLWLVTSAADRFQGLPVRPVRDLVDPPGNHSGHIRPAATCTGPRTRGWGC